MSDCSSCSSAAQAASSQDLVLQMALLKRQQDAARIQGAAAVELLTAAARLSRAAGKGEQFDAQG